MNSTQRNWVIVAVVVLLVIVCGFAIWKTQTPAAETTPAPTNNSTTLIDEKTALAQLQTDMQNITPHFIVPTWQQGQKLTLQEQTIATDTAELLAVQQSLTQPDQPATTAEQVLEFEISLDAIGKRYILITYSGADRTSESILDSQTGQITGIPGVIPLYLPAKNIALNVDSQAIYEYSLDQASSTLVAGSKLQGTETYNDGVAQMGPPINIQETHTDSSVTISIFDSNKVVPDPDGGNMYMKVGQKTLSF